MCKFTEFDFNYETMDLSVIVDDCMKVVDDTAYDYDGEITLEGMESLVNEWFESREELAREWGATRLAIEVEGIDYQKARGIIKDFAYKLVQGCDWVYKREEFTATYLHIRNASLSDSLYNLVDWLRDERNTENILNNRLDNLTNSIDENIILDVTGLKKGVKVSKLILSYLNAIVNELELAPVLLKEYQKEIDIISQNYSKIIELFKQCNAKHTVYLSCDVRDFLRCSYGNGWKSCHRLGGEFGSGAISYTLNPNVLIAYVSKDDATLDWREIVYVDFSQRLFVGSRQYKNSNPSFMKAVQSIILNQYGNDLELFDASNTVEVQKYSKKFIKFSYYDNAFAYNDIHLYDGIDAHIWVLKAPDVDHTNCTKIDIQTSQIICLQCGEYTDFIESDVCTCRRCMGYETYVCDICGEYHDEEDIQYIEYYDEYGHECEGYVCNECISENMFFCNHCQRHHHLDNEYVIVEGIGVVCESCVRYNLATGDYVQCDDCQTVFDAYYMSLTDVDGLSLCDDCIDNTAEYCLGCGKPHLVGELNNGLCKDCDDKIDSLVDELMSNYEL